VTKPNPVPTGIEVAVLLRRAQLRKQMACEAELADVGMTLPQWGMLLAVASLPDSSTHALALFTGQSDQSAGAGVARLEQRGLLERRSEGGRAILHRITSAGEDLVRRCDAIVAGVMDQLLAGLSDTDLRVLAASLIAIAEAARGGAARPGAAPPPTRATAPIMGDISGLAGNRRGRSAGNADVLPHARPLAD
jgi:DNA-binding MarR family transcriptional regulator